MLMLLLLLSEGSGDPSPPVFPAPEGLVKPVRVVAVYVGI